VSVRTRESSEQTHLADKGLLLQRAALALVLRHELAPLLLERVGHGRARLLHRHGLRHEGQEHLRKVEVGVAREVELHLLRRARAGRRREGLGVRRRGQQERGMCGAESRDVGGEEGARGGEGARLQQPARSVRMPPRV
jgi:hypothetical protein